MVEKNDISSLCSHKKSYFYKHMKKGIAIVLLLCYMLCALGVTFSFHHCMGELRYVNVHSDAEKKCCGSKKMPDDCCKTVKVTFKKNDDKPQSFFSFLCKKISAPEAAVFPSASPVIATRFGFASESNFHLRPPPLQPADLPLYILHSVYRI